MDVMAYYARLRTLNGYLNWLPGDDPPVLSSAQLSQAFHDGMPEKWRVLYRNAGRSARKDTQAELQRFFRKQQSAASRSMRANQKGQKAAARSRSKSNRKEASGRFNDRSFGKKKKESKFRTKGKSTDKKLVNGRIADDASCPVHPKSNHTWGECSCNHYRRQNADGDKKPAAKPNKPKGKAKNADVNVMVEEPLNWDSSDDEHDDRSAMNDDDDDDDRDIESVDGHMALAETKQGMEDLSLDDPVPKKRKSANDDAGKFIAFVSLDIPHHFDFFTLSQESSGCSHTLDEVELLYVQHHDEKYSNGVNNNSDSISFDDKLRLRATSHAVCRRYSVPKSINSCEFSLTLALIKLC